jgi:hypothetical protein
MEFFSTNQPRRRGGTEIHERVLLPISVVSSPFFHQLQLFIHQQNMYFAPRSRRKVDENFDRSQSKISVPKGIH